MLRVILINWSRTFIKGADFMGIYEEFFHSHFFDENGAIDQFAVLKPYDGKKENIIAFETGYGEGFYASYIGYSSEISQLN
jgi:hypothetical protein